MFGTDPIAMDRLLIDVIDGKRKSEGGPDTRFGIFTRLFDLPPADITRGGQAAQAAQAGLFMENFEWSQIQPTASTWDWTKADAVLAALPATTPLAVELFLVPGWANDNRGDYAPPMQLISNEPHSLSSMASTLGHTGALDWLDVVTNTPAVIYHPGEDYAGDLTTGSIRRTATSSIPDGATVYCKFFLPSYTSSATLISNRAVTLHGTDWAVVESGWTPGSDDLARKAVASLIISSVPMAEIGTDYMMHYGDPGTIQWLTGSSLPEGSPVYVSYFVMDPTPMADFAKACVQRYGSRIKQWQIWDEPNFMWNPVPDPVNYGILAKACSAAIKSADSTAQVLVGAPSSIDQNFLTKALAYVGSGNVDVITFHSFGGSSPEVMADGLSLYQEIVNLDSTLTAMGFTQPFWNTSFGWQTGDGELTEEVQAQYLVRSCVQMAAVPRVQGATWFCLADFGGVGYTDGLMTIDFKPKLSYNAFGVMSKLLSNVPFQNRLDLGSNKRIGAVFATTDLKITVLWLVGSSETLMIPVTYPHVSAVSLYGHETPLPVKDGQVSVTLSTEPVYLVEWQNGAHTPAYGFNLENDDVFVYPNPSRGKVNLVFHMDQPGEVKVQVYNIKGEQVSTITEQEATAGDQVVLWQSEGLAPGVYLVRITAGGIQYQVKKVAHLR